jgi:hypothetical protein
LAARHWCSTTVAASESLSPVQCAWHTRKSTAHPSCDIKTPVRVSRAQRSSRRPERDSARSDALDSKPCWRDCGCPASPTSAVQCAWYTRKSTAHPSCDIKAPVRVSHAQRSSRRPELDSARSDALDSKPCWRDCGCPASVCTRKSTAHPSCDIKTPVRVSRAQRSSRRPERDSARSDALDSKPCWRDCGCPASASAIQRDPTRLTASRVGEIVGVPLL